MPHVLPWQLVVPLKSRHRAKTRLEPPAGVARETLAYAMACDTLEAAVESIGADAVWVVTADPSVTRFASRLGCRIVGDRDRGLNHAVRAGLHAAGSVSTARGVLLGDLPALRAGELDLALRQAADHPIAMVADRHDEGTTLLTAQGVPLAPLFGADSARRHRASLGAVSILGGLPTLRCDVDTRADLRAAHRLGLGPSTAAALADDTGEPAVAGH